MKTVDFSETIAASDLKQMDLIKIWSVEGQGHFFTLVVYIQKFIPDFLRNYCVDLNQTLYESFQVQGNENLMT